jgi:general secretion pathway protein D
MSRAALAAAAAFFLAACATDSAFLRGKAMIEQGRYEEGLQQVDQAARAEPENAEYRAYYVRTRDTYLSTLLAEAEKQHLAGRVDDAAPFYLRVLALDARNERALAGLTTIEADRRHRQATGEAQKLAEDGKLNEAEAKVRAVLAENPAQREAKALARAIDERRLKDAPPPAVLKSALDKPVTLEFREAPLKSVFEVLSRSSGINIVFDREVRTDLRATIYVRDTRIEDVLRFLLVTNQLQHKVMNSNTILVYPNAPAKVRDYQDLVVKSFYLGNADVKAAANLVRTVLRTRDLYFDERLGLLVMRDTAETVRLAEKLLAAQDLADPEVMLEVEVLEVTRTRLTELGARFPSVLAYSLVGAAGVAGQLTLAEWLARSAGLVRLTVSDPFFVLNLKQQNGDLNLLANPRIRVRNRDKAKIHVGDKVPVITTTVAANVGISESVAYLDVGLRLDVEPTVHLNDDIAIKIGLEVSSITQEIKSTNGTLVYRIGTRNAATTLRLKNGETQVLAGLIQKEDRSTQDKVPGLGELPTIGRLFSSNRDQNTKTEVLLLITPYVMRNLERPPAPMLEFAGGTEGATGAAPMALPTAVHQQPVAPAAPKPAAPGPGPQPTPPATTPQPTFPGTPQPFKPAPVPSATPQ